MSQLKLYLLGSPRIERDGLTVRVDTRKAIALLAYLAVTGKTHRRDALATLLWPDADQTHARAALRRTLSTVNKALAGHGLKVDRETLGLDWNAGLWVDLVRFRLSLADCLAHPHHSADACKACQTSLVEAVELYRDDFMVGFTLRDSPAFDDWQSSQSEAMRLLLADALERLSKFHTAKGEFEPAIAHTRRRLALDPLNESVHRRLMELYSWAGQRAVALRQYRECVRVLDRELGVPPLEETSLLYQALREGPLPPAQIAVPAQPISRERSSELAPIPGETSSAARLGAYPLVGRSAEWETLLRVYERIGGDGHLIVLEGEAGIGKTRLAEEFLAYARLKGATTIAARCFREESTLSYAPFIEWLRATAGHPDGAGDTLEELPAHWLSEASRLLPELGGLRSGLPPAPPLDNPGAQSRFFEAISHILLALCRGPSPGVLLLDDLHWADESSIDLLTYMARRLNGRPICMLATWRREQMPPGHRMLLLVADAQRTGAATLLPLERLSQSGVAKLVQSIGSDDESLPEGLEKHLYSQTEGLPFFLVEYLAALRKGADIGSEEWPMPTSVRVLLHSRLVTVSETSRQLLDTAAVIGRSFDFDTLRDASGRVEEETVASLDALIAQGLVTEVRGGDTAGGLIYDFSHEQLRALAYEETSLARRRLLHRRIAEAVVARARVRGETDSSASLIARHHRMAGQDMEAAEFFKLAGKHARELFANADGLSHFRSALELGHSDSAGIHEAIGDLQTLLGEYGAALTSYETAAAICDPVSLSGVERKLGGVYLRRGDWELAESHFDAALAELGEEGAPDQRSRLYADLSLATHHRGHTGPALDLAGRAAELAEAANDSSALAQANNILGILARGQGDHGRACNHLEISLTLAETLSDPSAQVAALNNLALARTAAGEIERAIELTERALTLCASRGDRHREAAIHSNLADLLHAAGRSEAAMSQLKEAATIFAEIGADSGPMQPEIWKLV